jgi:hypothetical protein
VLAKLGKVTSNLIMSVYPSVNQLVAMEQLGSHREDFHEFRYLSIFGKSIEKFQVSLTHWHTNFLRKK